MSEPTAPALSHHFSSLIGRSVTFARVPPGRESLAKQIYGIFTNAQSETPIIVKADLSLLGAFAGALVGLPDSEVRERIKGTAIEELLRDAIYEVLNVASSVVAAEGRTTLSSMTTDLSELGNETKDIIAKPSHRIDFDVTVDDYEGGRFTVLS